MPLLSQNMNKKLQSQSLPLIIFKETSTAAFTISIHPRSTTLSRPAPSSRPSPAPQPLRTALPASSWCLPNPPPTFWHSRLCSPLWNTSTPSSARLSHRLPSGDANSGRQVPTLLLLLPPHTGFRGAGSSPTRHWDAPVRLGSAVPLRMPGNVVVAVASRHFVCARQKTGHWIRCSHCSHFSARRRSTDSVAVARRFLPFSSRCKSSTASPISHLYLASLANSVATELPHAVVCDGNGTISGRIRQSGQNRLRERR